MVQSVGGEGSADTGVQWLGGRANPVVRAVHMCTGSLFVVSGLAAAPAIDDDLGAGTLGDEVRLRRRCDPPAAYCVWVRVETTG
jgi:hypothetical protein